MLAGRRRSPGGTLLVVHHAEFDPDHARERGFDPADYVQPAQVAALLDDDWQVEVDETRPRSVESGAGAGHTVDHADLKPLSVANAEHQVCDDRNALLAQGFTPESFAYPFGSFDAGSEQIVHDCGYNSGRGVAGGTETIPPLDPYATRTPPNPKKATKLATIEGYITDAQNNGGGWVQLVFRNVCTKCDAYQITPDHFTALLDWIQGQEANGVTVETTAQVIGGPFNPAVAP